MKTLTGRSRWALALPLTLFAGGALAQSTPAPAPTLIPGLENFRLPGDRAPTPRPSPTPTPTPAASPRVVPPPVIRTAPAARPSPAATTPVRRTPIPSAAAVSSRPTPSPTPQPTALTTPLATPAPATVASPPAIVAPPPAIIATPTPTSVAAPAAASPYAAPPSSSLRWYALGAVALLFVGGLVMFALMFIRRGRDSEEHREISIVALGDYDATAHAFPPTAAPPPPVDLPPPAQKPASAPSPAFFPPPMVEPQAEVQPDMPRARIEIELRPLRAGTNLTSAAVDYDIRLHNKGEVAAQGIRIDTRLLSASADQDAVLAALFAAPIDKPVVAPFDLDAGGEVALGGMAMLPLAALHVMSVQDKAFFVPVMAVNVHYHWSPGEAEGGTGQVARAYIVGIDRGTDAKMAPFRVDTDPRMFDAVSQRPHALAVER